MRLTKSVVDGLEPGSKERVTWCEKLSGFGCRVWPTGKKVFVVQYRAGGRIRKKTIGTFGVLTVEQARKKAEVILAGVQLGRDPVAEDRKLRDAMTVSQLCDEYIAHGMAAKKPSTIKTDLCRIDAHIKPLLGRRKITDVSRRDIERFMTDIADGKSARDKRTSKRGRSRVTGGKGTATRTVRLLGGILTYAVNQGYIASNPRARVQLYPDRRMERYLSGEEIDRLFATLDLAETLGLPWHLNDDAQTKHRPANPANLTEKISPHVTAAIRLLVLTGCRLREILHLKWTDVDLERRCLVLPDSKTGRRVIPLSSAALTILEHLPELGMFVIRGMYSDQPRSDLKKPWARISAHAGLSDVRLHDLRHTFASLGAANGVSLQMIGALLGHKSTQTTARYAHLSDDLMRNALDQITRSIPTKTKNTNKNNKLRC